MTRKIISPKAFAFFDVDDTLISVKSLLSFQDYWYAWTGDKAGKERYSSEISDLISQDAPWEYVNRCYYAYFAGRKVDEVKRCVNLWYMDTERKLHQAGKTLFHPAVIERMNQHRCENIEPVFVSGSFMLLLAPFAQLLSVEHMLAIRQQVVDGVFTGHILPPQTIGQGKADAVLSFLEQRRVDPEECFAYGDDITDAPMLGCVGYPCVIRGGRRLEEHAQQVGWPVMDPG